MRSSWTPAVDRALNLAQALASTAGVEEVCPVHLAHGLLAEGEGQAAALAIASGLAWAAYRRGVPDFPADGIPDGPLPLSGVTQTILRDARELAFEFAGDRTVAGDCLLLALVRGCAEVAQSLEPFGFQVDRLNAYIEANRAPPLDLDEPLRLGENTEQVDLARIIDANANRAREGLRVTEDYCRFVLDDAFLCRELKTLRHELTALLSAIPSGALFAGRETLRDVGTAVTTETEYKRYSLLDVAQANLKRLQEALRVLEEFGKVQGPEIGAGCERLRYRCYTLERAIVLGTTARKRLHEARLYVLLGAGQCVASLEWTVRQAVSGGAQIVQLREKSLPDNVLLDRARQVRGLTRELGVLFIVNDRPDIAQLSEADGVHLGQEDLPVKEARRILGPDTLIGVSTHDISQVRKAVLDGASYLGVGPTFPSLTKHFSETAGLEFVRAAHAETTLPMYALGGIDLRTIGAAVSAGARRVAVSHAIAGADDPRAIAYQLICALPDL